MRYLIHLTILIIIFSLSLSCERIDELEDAQQMVKQTLDNFYSSQEQMDLRSISSLYRQHANVILLGPGMNDRITNREQIQEYWGQFLGETQEIKVWRRDEIFQINHKGDVAWASSVNRMESKIENEWVTVRYFFTGVLEKTGGRWLFVQTHISIPQDSTFKPDLKTLETKQLHSEPHENQVESMELQKENLEDKGQPLQFDKDSSSKSIQKISKDEIETAIDTAKIVPDTSSNKSST